MSHRTTILFLIASAVTSFAGVDGYLHHCSPLAIRFADPPLSPPPVNELVLALDDLPPEEEGPVAEASYELPEINDGAVFNKPLTDALITGDTPMASPPPP